MKKIIHTTKAPAPIGPYSQAILINDTLYTSGQIALDADSGELVDSNITLETRKVMKNMEAVLEAAGMTFDNVVKSSIFLSDMRNFTSVNNVYASYFDANAAPARENC